MFGTFDYMNDYLLFIYLAQHRNENKIVDERKLLRQI